VLDPVVQRAVDERSAAAELFARVRDFGANRE
jgi:hypothetical protein